MAAWLYWVGAPRDTEIAGLDAEGGLALDPTKPITIGRVLADPDQTFRGADDADRLRVDLERALDAADPDSRDLVVHELDRRFAFAQPRRGRGLCTLCLLGEANLPERVLRGCTGTICRSCLRGASAVRHIRG